MKDNLKLKDVTGSITEDELTKLNSQLDHHMKKIIKCTTFTENYGRLLLASPPDSRYPYIYPRDTAAAVQLLRRLAISKHHYNVRDQAYELMKNMAFFMKDVLKQYGHWGQRYSLSGEEKGIYKQEDNIAHGIAILCNFLLTAHSLKREIDDLEGFLHAIQTAIDYSIKHFYQKELNLFHSTTAIHESAIEAGYTCWVNFAYLHAFSLAEEVTHVLDHQGIIPQNYVDFRRNFLYSVCELFMSGDRYVRRLDPQGNMDFRPDFTLLSPFYFGFVNYKREMEKNVNFLEKQLWDPQLGMIMRYLPFYRDPAIHVHAGNGPWLHYTAILAQFHFWNGATSRGNELLALIDQYSNEEGEIPEHLSTYKRLEGFLETEWKTGIDFNKEFNKSILLDHVDFNKILEEANNMSRSYEETQKKCVLSANGNHEGGFIRFATPLMWSHVEYSRALLFRAKDWWSIN